MAVFPRSSYSEEIEAALTRARNRCRPRVRVFSRPAEADPTGAGHLAAAARRPLLPDLSVGQGAAQAGVGPILLTWILAGLAWLLLAATALSFARIPHGAFRVLAFPRLQILAFAALLFAAILLFGEHGTVRALAMVALVVVAVAQAVCIAQFLPLLRRPQSVLFAGDPAGPDTVSILSANVKQGNRRYDAVLAVAREADADLALFMETDEPWAEALEVLRERYPHVVSHPLDNAYGMILFSRLPLDEVECRYLVMEGVPSIRCIVRLRDGQRFRLYCVHPEPPVPVSDSLGRDGELATVAKLVAEDRLPAVVSGDLNDVAWSNTTRMFQRLSRLLDPRVGRGLYNTFDARFPFMRWPLDHLFHDPRFALVSMRRMPAGGSDHFPMLFRLGLRRDASGVEMPDEADAADREHAAEIRRDARKLDRDPIGSDWES